MKNLIFILSVMVSVRLVAQDKTKTAAAGKIYSIVPQMPQFPGGNDSLTRYLKGHLLYPKEAQSKNIEGKVLVRFVVDIDGSVEDVTVMKGADPALDKEAIRVVSMFPRFKPGYVQGEPVKAYYNLPVTFKLPK